MRPLLRSLMVLGSVSVLLMGMSQTVGSQTQSTAPAGEREELRGTEFPFPVGWVAGEADESYVGREAIGAGALPEAAAPAAELRGTEFPFPVGFVPEGQE